jgi:DNA-binding LacI/PurR family transcriptional regulator/DNA-binding transcriptional regulator YhcF (GntR family)
MIRKGMQDDEEGAGTSLRLYEAVADRLRERMQGSPGGRLEPVKLLAREMGVSKGTLQKALDSLRAEGKLQSYRGKGTFWGAADAGQSPRAPGRSLETVSGILRTRIQEGTYRSGQPLPKVGHLASQERVSPDTVCAALKVLESESLIWKQGKSWVAGRRPQAGRANQALARGARATPAILLVTPEYSAWENLYHEEHTGKFVQNFYLEIERMGLETQLVLMEKGSAGHFPMGRSRVQDLIRSLEGRYLGAMCIGNSDTEWVGWLAGFRKPVVWLDLQCPSEDLDMKALPGGDRCFRCLKDEESSAAMAIETLAGLGHKRIGFPWLKSKDFPWVDHRLALLKEKAAAWETPVEIVAVEHEEGFWHPQPWNGPDGFRSWLDGEIKHPAANGSNGNGGPTLRTRLSLREKAPSLGRLLDEEGVTALLAPNDFFAHQYYHWLRATGYRMPDDVSLLSFDNNRYSRPFSISSIDFGFGELAYRAAHIFLGDLPVKADGKHTLHSRPYLLARETLGPPRKARLR